MNKIISSPKIKIEVEYPVKKASKLKAIVATEKTKKRKARQKAYYLKNKAKKLKQSTPDIIENIEEMKPTTIKVDFN